MLVRPVPACPVRARTAHERPAVDALRAFQPKVRSTSSSNYHRRDDGPENALGPPLVAAMDPRRHGSDDMTENERKAFVKAATIREVDNRDPIRVAVWREAEAAALRQALLALQAERS